MIAFYILVFIAIILLWFGLGWTFKGIGILASKYFGDTIDIIKEKDKEN